MTTNLPVRYGPGAAVKLRAGQEWWEDNPHRLAARLRTDRTVREVARYELSPRLHAAVVVRLKPRPSRARRVGLWALGTFVALTGAGIALWALLKALAPFIAAALPAAFVCAGLYALVKILTGHRPGCVGLHCPGCRH